MKNKKMAPIGVFDSGVGGLTVAREISRQLPYENIVYFGDTARVPYGSKSQNTIIRFSEQIIRFLRTKQVKAIVIACNTASALALDAVKDEFDLPIIGVVIPGARAAVEATTNGKVGVVGTEATVQSGMYTKVIQGMNPKIEVIEKACPLFVPLVEEGFKEHIVTREIIEYYLESMRNTDIDAMILGCTHYPLLRSKIREYMGDKIQIVNPAYETAMDLKRLLEEKEMANDETTEHHSEYSFYVSDAAEKFMLLAGDAGQGLEPVGVMGGTQLHSPALHHAGNDVCHLNIQRSTLVQGVLQALISSAGQALLHNVLIKDLAAVDLHNICCHKSYSLLDLTFFFRLGSAAMQKPKACLHLNKNGAASQEVTHSAVAVYG